MHQSLNDDLKPCGSTSTPIRRSGGGPRVIDLPLLNGCVIVAGSFPRTARCLPEASYTDEYPLPDPEHQEHAPWRCDIQVADGAPPSHCCVSPRAPAQAGRMEEARRVMAELLALDPRSRLARGRSSAGPWRRPDDNQPVG